MVYGSYYNLKAIEMAKEPLYKEMQDGKGSTCAAEEVVNNWMNSLACITYIIWKLGEEFPFSAGIRYMPAQLLSWSVGPSAEWVIYGGKELLYSLMPGNVGL